MTRRHRQRAHIGMARCMLATLAVASVAAAASARDVATPALIPLPADMTLEHGALRLRAGDRIVVAADDGAAQRIAHQAVDLVTRLGGPRLTIATRGDAAIRFVRAPGIAAEAYRLDVTGRGVVVTASDDAGLFYGAMTLVQLLTPGTGSAGETVRIPRLTIRDRPRFAWRGVMLDVARHMLPVAEIRTVIDQMAQHKLNTLQLHLTDDQGWRIEIKRYPALTAIGAYRTAPVTGSPTDGARYGGFYTQDELRALVAYAADRAITIVPEIDMPGHAQAAIAAYPAIGVLGDRPAVSADWGINPYLFGVDDESSAFIDGVLDEVLAIFPSRFIHVGGDEALKDQWRASPAVQARMRALGIADEDRLQSWFIDRLGRYLAARGRRLIGWDEILDGGLPPSASVMSWRGEAGAVAAATMGHDVVLSPGPTLYFDNLQSERGDEPPGRLKVQTLADVYRYDPLPAALPADKAAHVLGAQANLWSEYLVTPAEVEHALFPRLDALAEITWSPRSGRDWPGFLNRLEPQMARYRRQSVAAADSAFAVDFALDRPVGAALDAGTVGVLMTNQTAHGVVRFTTDGSEPLSTSRRYAGVVAVPLGTRLRARTFDDGQPLSAIRNFVTNPATLMLRDSAGLRPCPGAGIRLRLPLTPDAVTGPAFAMNIFDSCWIYPQAPLRQASGIVLRLGRIARNFALRDTQRRSVVWRYGPTSHGTVIVRVGTCDGSIVASLPIPDPAHTPNSFTLTAPLVAPATSVESDLCIVTIPPEGGPIYGIERVEFQPR